MPNDNFVWVEVIPLLFGDFYCPVLGDEGNLTPLVYLTEEEALEELTSCQKDYAEQIALGERDSDDEYEGVIYPAIVNEDFIDLYDKDTGEQIDSFNWHTSI